MMASDWLRNAGGLTRFARNFQDRDLAERVLAAKIRRVLLAARARHVHERGFVGEPLHPQCDAYAIRRRAPPIREQLHLRAL